MSDHSKLPAGPLCPHINGPLATLPLTVDHTPLAPVRGLIIGSDPEVKTTLRVETLAARFRV